MSPLPGGRKHYVIPYGMWVPVAAMAGLPASCYTLPLPLPLPLWHRSSSLFGLLGQHSQFFVSALVHYMSKFIWPWPSFTFYHFKPLTSSGLRRDRLSLHHSAFSCRYISHLPTLPVRLFCISWSDLAFLLGSLHFPSDLAVSLNKKHPFLSISPSFLLVSFTNNIKQKIH